MIRTLLAIILPFCLFTVALAAVTEECNNETRVLQNDRTLNEIQNQMYNYYRAEFERECKFESLGSPDCDIEFNGDNATHAEACAARGGQVLKRNVTIACGVNFQIHRDLGVVPVCVGSSCVLEEVRKTDLSDEDVKRFLEDISASGCASDLSAEQSGGAPMMSLFGVSVVALVLGVVGI